MFFVSRYVGYNKLGPAKHFCVYSRAREISESSVSRGETDRNPAKHLHDDRCLMC